ncbi:MAG: PEP-CTERM sorting domain-containing protein [Thermoguttaceae bacterium]
MMWRSFLCVAALLGLTAVASAGTAGYNVYLTYAGSYDADGTQVDDLASTLTTLSDGSTKTTLTLDSTAVVHAFTVSVSVHDLAAGQNPSSFQFACSTTGGVTLGDDAAGGGVSGGNYVASDLAQTALNPPRMGNATSGSSDASSAIPWAENSINPQNNFIWIAKRGSTQTGNGNGTYGDYIAAMAVGQNSTYEMGTMYLSTTDAGAFSLSFITNAEGYFGTLTNNQDGLATSANLTYLTGYQAVGDSIEFQTVPEPGTIALLLSGMIGLVAYAWRKRK